MGRGAKDKKTEISLRDLSQEDLLSLNVKTQQEVARRADPLPELTVKVKERSSIMIVSFGDLHLGSLSTDHGAVIKLRDQVLATPGAYVVLQGDEIEGFVQKYLSTNILNSVDLDTQLQIFRNLIRPLYEAGKIVGMVTEYFGHPGWTVDSSGLDMWSVMLNDMSDIPRLQNGAVITFQFPNKHTQTMQVFHNPGKRSKVDPVAGLRESSGRADVKTGAHFHQAGAESSEAGVFLQQGTPKGSSLDGLSQDGSSAVIPDPYGLRGGWGPTDPLNDGVLMRPRTRRQAEITRPVLGLDQEGWLLMTALNALNDAERQGITQELVEEIRAKENPPEFHYNPRASVLSGSEPLIDKHNKQKALERARKQNPDADPTEVKSPWFDVPYQKPYERLGYSVEAALPFAIDLIANVRWGSASAPRPEFAQYIQDIAEDPYRFALWLGNIIDRDLGKLPNRKRYLDEIAEMMVGIGDRNIGMLLSETLTYAAWKRSVSGATLSQDTLPIAPASYLAMNGGVKLLNNLAVVDMRFQIKDQKTGKPARKTFTPIDRMGNRGSLVKPLWGHESMYRSGFFDENPSVVVGGHTPGSGWAQFYDRQNNPTTDRPIMMAPGWWSRVDTIGKGNARKGGKPGKSIIAAPVDGSYLMYPTETVGDPFEPVEAGVYLYPVESVSEQQDFINALTIQIGLAKAGQLDRIRRQPASKRAR